MYVSPPSENVSRRLLSAQTALLIISLNVTRQIGTGQFVALALHVCLCNIYTNNE